MDLSIYLVVQGEVFRRPSRPPQFYRPDFFCQDPLDKVFLHRILPP
jgi:hypothetical protein